MDTSLTLKKAHFANDRTSVTIGQSVSNHIHFVFGSNNYWFYLYTTILFVVKLDEKPNMM